jgi:hypothetical protein
MNEKYSLKDLKKASKKNLLNEVHSPQDIELKHRTEADHEQTKRGRKPKAEESKLTEKVTVNFTSAEVDALKELATNNFDIPLPKLIRGILKEHKII